MANVIVHNSTGAKVHTGDIVATPDGPAPVDFTSYTWKGAAVWTRTEGGPSKRWLASECGCRVTSID